MSFKRFESMLDNKLDKTTGAFRLLSHSKEHLPFWPDDDRPEFEAVKKNRKGMQSPPHAMMLPYK